MKELVSFPTRFVNVGDWLAEVFDGLDVNEVTRKEYQQRAPFFISFVSSHGFDRNSIVAFKRHLERRAEWSVATRNKYLTTAKVLVRELYRVGALPVDITVNVKGFRQTKLHRRDGLNDVEIRLLAEAVRKLPNDRFGARTKVLFALLVFQGLRQIEVTRLDVGDIKLDAGVAYVRGKGRDDKEAVWLAPQTVKALRRYLCATGFLSGPLFRSFGNRKVDRLNTMTIKREMKKLMRPLGIMKAVHGCRHYYTTALLRRLNPMDAMKFTRHRSLDMLLVYNDEMSAERQSKEVFRCFSGIGI